MTNHSLIDRFRQARRDTTLVTLDGLHALKHALRFNADVVEMVTPSAETALRLAAEVAPDILRMMENELTVVSHEDFQLLSPVPPDTSVIAIARRPVVLPNDIVDGPSDAPVVLLENPRNPFNIGAAVRVAAAAGAAGVLVTGAQDPWHPAAIVSAAGLQFALPVARADGIPETDRPIMAIDPYGDPMPWGSVALASILAFGTERSGATDDLLQRSNGRLAIPMMPGVSSLNLATSVAVALYSLKFA